MSIRRPRATMSPEELTHVRRQDKHRNVRRQQGIRYMVDATPAMKHVRWLHDDMGMTFDEVATAADMAQSTIRILYRGIGRGGEPSTMKPRHTVEKVLKAQPQARITENAQIPAVATRRRLQALSAEGFPTWFLRDRLGMRTVNQAWMIQSGRGQRPTAAVTYATARNVAEVYAKLAGTVPADYGITPYAQARARTAAAKNGYAPSSCWDDDTIDNVGAIPEWTGECGSFAGWLIHRREDIPFCGPCLAADAAGCANTGTSLLFKPDALYEARMRRGISRPVLAAAIGFSDDSIGGWERGRTQPKYRLVELMADFLNVPISDLYEDR